MKISAISNQNNYGHNVSHKAVFKPNMELKKLFSKEIRNSCQLSVSAIDSFARLPQHELEILETRSVSMEKILCSVFNNRTKRASEYRVSDTYPLSDLMEQVSKDLVLFDEYQLVNNPARQFRKITTFKL